MKRIFILVSIFVLFGCQSKKIIQEQTDYRDVFTGKYQFTTDFITTEWVLDTAKVDTTIGEITKADEPHTILITIDVSDHAKEREKFIRRNSYKMRITPDGKMVYLISDQNRSNFPMIHGRSYTDGVYFPGEIKNDSILIEGTLITWSTGISYYMHYGKRI